MLFYIVPALGGMVVLTVALGIYRLGMKDSRVTHRLRKIGGRSRSGTEDPEVAMSGEDLPFWIRPLKYLSWILPGNANSEVLRWELASAGYRHEDARRVFAGLRIVLTVAVTYAAIFVTAEFTRLGRTEALLVCGVAAFVGFMAPYMLLRLRQKKRQEEITFALPDALDLLVICIEAGQGLNAALQSVSRESSMHSPAMCQELRLVNLEMSAGVSRRQALRNLALRTGIDDVRALVAVLVQSDKFGTSVGQALRTHSASLRIRRRQRAEEAARKTPVKMVFPLVFCIFPALLVVILAPGFLDLIRALSGNE
jgi:tight adherence protein C